MFSDARNERERAAGDFSGRSSTAGGRSGTFDSRARNPRYDQRSIATRPATFGNIAGAILGGLPGPSMALKGVGLISGHMLGFDPYSGPVGRTTEYSYDSPNRAGRIGPMPGQGSILTQKRLAAEAARSRGLRAPAPAAAPAGLLYRPQTVSPKVLNIGGGLPYSLTIPGWSY